jgi:hypothetical protein
MGLMHFVRGEIVDSTCVPISARRRAPQISQEEWLPGIGSQLCLDIRAQPVQSFAMRNRFISIVVLCLAMAGLCALAQTTEPPITTPITVPSADEGEAQASPGAALIGAVCQDGTETSATGRLACSHHGGVKCWKYADGTCE